MILIRTATSSWSSTSTSPTGGDRAPRFARRAPRHPRCGSSPPLEIRKRSIDAPPRPASGSTSSSASPATIPPGGPSAARRSTGEPVIVIGAGARPACSAPTSSRAPACASVDPGSRQAGAGAPPRPQGISRSTGAVDERLQLLLRRGRRRHVLRRQARPLMGAQARRHPRRHRDPRLATARPPGDPRRRAPAHRLEQAAQGDHRDARALERAGCEIQFGARVDRPRGTRRPRDRRGASPTAVQPIGRAVVWSPSATPRAISTTSSRARRCGLEAQAVRDGRAHRAPAAARRSHPVRQATPVTPRPRPAPYRSRVHAVRRLAAARSAFCMCPGWLDRAGGDRARRLSVVNGMSLFAPRLAVREQAGSWCRSSRGSARVGLGDPGGGQPDRRHRAAAHARARGGGRGRRLVCAPATRATDFVRGRGRRRRSATSYEPGRSRQRRRRRCSTRPGCCPRRDCARR